MAKIFKIPVTWEVYDTIEVKAESLEEAVAWTIKNLDDIPLGTEPEYIDGSYRIDVDTTSNNVDDIVYYLKYCLGYVEE